MCAARTLMTKPPGNGPAAHRHGGRRYGRMKRAVIFCPLSLTRERVRVRVFLRAQTWHFHSRQGEGINDTQPGKN